MIVTILVFVIYPWVKLMKALQWEWMLRSKIQVSDNLACQIHQVFLMEWGCQEGGALRA